MTLSIKWIYSMTFTFRSLADVALPDITVVGGPGFVIIRLIVVHPDTGIVHRITEDKNLF